MTDIVSTAKFTQNVLRIRRFQVALIMQLLQVLEVLLGITLQHKSFLIRRAGAEISYELKTKYIVHQFSRSEVGLQLMLEVL